MVTPRGFKQGEGADDIGADEIGRAVDRAVDVAFGGQMHDRVRVVGFEGLAHGCGVGDVGAEQNLCRWWCLASSR